MKRVIGAALSAVLLVVAASTNLRQQPAMAAIASPAKHEKKDARRLPLNVVPSKYVINIHPDLEKAVFSGDETITLNIAGEPADAIYLHSKELKVEAQSVLGPKKGMKLQMQDLPSEGMLALRAGYQLPPGEYSIKLKFSGKLNDKLVGFYKSTFKDSAGKTHTMAVTQMEPCDARRMFPCFDEPSLKAIFQLNVTTKRGLTAISNAPVDRRMDSETSSVWSFKPTPKMSSYLVALVVGDLRATEPKTVNGVPVTVWSVPGKEHLGSYSRDEAAKILPVLTSYFGTDYPWGKLDLIAIPDFEAGAMENPGAISFREVLLLIDPKTASSGTKRSATSVIAHEMAHLWFGDLVTMKWWDDLWLNEAFATWMATKAVDSVHPEWEEWKGYARDRAGSMGTDALKASRAIHAPVGNPEIAHEMFDPITYEKGASVLRMLERYVSEPTFQQGVQGYIAKHAFGNATTEDLWEAIGTASGAPVKTMMQGWVHQAGYPVLTLGKQTEEGVPLQQNRFLLCGLPSGTEDKLWQVPIGIRTLTGPVAQNQQTPPQQKQIMTDRTDTIKLSAPAASVWANAGGVGYYRLHYPSEAYGPLSSLALKQLDPSERLALVDDTWALTQARIVDLHDDLQVISALREDADDAVAGAIMDQLSFLDDFVDASDRPAFERFVRAQLAPLYAKLGWTAQPNDSQQTRMLRGSVLDTLGTIGQNKEVIAKARELFTKLSASKPGTTGGLDGDIVGPVTTIVAYNGGKKEFDFFKRRHETAKTPEEEERNLHALTQFHSPELIGQVLSMSVNGTVRMQDAPGMLRHMISRRDTNTRAWQFMENNWSRIAQVYPQEMIPRAVSGASSFNTKESLERTRKFLQAHPIKSGESTVRRTLERIEFHTAFRDRYQKQLRDWLKQHYGTVAKPTGAH